MKGKYLMLGNKQDFVLNIRNNKILIKQSNSPVNQRLQREYKFQRS